MGKFIASKFPDIQVIYSSSATRALDFAASIHKYSKTPLVVDEALYTFHVRRLIRFVLNLSQEYQSVALVAHNPALTEAINLLAQLEPEKKIVNLPTAAVAKLEFNVEAWSQIKPHDGQVVDFAKPKALDSFEDDLD